MNNKKCEWCGRPLEGKRADAAVCSRQCYESRRSRLLTEERKKNRPERCVQCGQPIPSSRRSDAVTCSVECNNQRMRKKRSDEARERRPDKCKECGSKLTDGLKVLEQYCSDGCRNAAKTRYNRNWRQRNTDKTSGYSKKWRSKNPDVVAFHRHKRRALMAGAFVEHVAASRVFERDGWVCGLCGEEINRSLCWPDPMSATIDHIVPLSQGGPHEYMNVQAAHLGCNSRKGARMDTPRVRKEVAEWTRKN